MKYFLFLVVIWSVLLIHVARAQDVVVSKSVCRDAIAHVSDADVAYTPGLDARGQPVEPADLEGSAVTTIPDEFIVDIRSFLGDALDLNLGELGSFTESTIIHVSYNSKTNEVLLNDKVLVSASDTHLQALCQEYYGPNPKGD